MDAIREDRKNASIVNKNMAIEAIVARLAIAILPPRLLSRVEDTDANRERDALLVLEEFGITFPIRNEKGLAYEIVRLRERLDKGLVVLRNRDNEVRLEFRVSHQALIDAIDPAALFEVSFRAVMDKLKEYARRFRPDYSAVALNTALSDIVKNPSRKETL
jgi:hypothetical protein